MNFAIRRKSTWSAYFPIMRARSAPGAARRRLPSPARRRDILSSISIAFSSPPASSERSPDFKMLTPLRQAEFAWGAPEADAAGLDAIRARAYAKAAANSGVGLRGA